MPSALRHRFASMTLYQASTYRGRFSSFTPEWSTLDGMFDALNRRYHFDLDTCATPENAATAFVLSGASGG